LLEEVKPADLFRQFKHIHVDTPLTKFPNFDFRLVSPVDTKDGEYVPPAHGLLQAVHLAFAKHYPLEITPDSVWITLLQGFGRHTNKGPEEYRSILVKHEGRQPVVRISQPGIEDHWETEIHAFQDLARKHLKPEVHDTLTPKFSTSSKIDIAVAQIALLESVRVFYALNLWTLCGIPQITVAGNPEDWKNIKKRLQFFRKFGDAMNAWANEVEPILDQFISAVEGKDIDTEFWKSIYKINSTSGGQNITGWITKLFPDVYSLPEDQRVLSKIPISLNSLYFVWNHLGVVHEMTIHGGLVGVKQNPDNFTVTPAPLWCVAPQDIEERVINMEENVRSKLRQRIRRFMRDFGNQDVPIANVLGPFGGWCHSPAGFGVNWNKRNVRIELYAMIESGELYAGWAEGKEPKEVGFVALQGTEKCKKWAELKKEKEKDEAEKAKQKE